MAQKLIYVGCSRILNRSWILKNASWILWSSRVWHFVAWLENREDWRSGFAWNVGTHCAAYAVSTHCNAVQTFISVRASSQVGHIPSCHKECISKCGLFSGRLYFCGERSVCVGSQSYLVFMLRLIWLRVISNGNMKRRLCLANWEYFLLTIPPFIRRYLNDETWKRGDNFLCISCF